MFPHHVDYILICKFVGVLVKKNAISKTHGEKKVKMVANSRVDIIIDDKM